MICVCFEASERGKSFVGSSAGDAFISRRAAFQSRESGGDQTRCVGALPSLHTGTIPLTRILARWASASDQLSWPPRCGYAPHFTKPPAAHTPSSPTCTRMKPLLLLHLKGSRCVFCSASEENAVPIVVSHNSLHGSSAAKPNPHDER
jgi:hypothetical protein